MLKKQFDLYMFLLLSFITGISSSVQAQLTLANSKDTYASKIGKKYEQFRSYIKQRSEKRALHPEDEAEIRAILKELKIEREIPLYAMTPAMISSSGDINAFARNNALYFNPCFNRTLSYEEKRFLIGHEAAHIERQHGCKQVILNVTLLLGGLIGNKVLNTYVWSKIQTTYKKHTAQIASFMVIGLIELLINAAYRRNQELEADRLSAFKGGAEGGIQFMDTLNTYYDDSRMHALWIEILLATHPSLQERKAQLRAL